MPPTWTDLTHFFLEPVRYFTDPNHRVFIGFLISSLLIALLVLRVQTQRPWREIFKIIFTTKIWRNKSTAVDAGLLCLNAFLKVLVFIPLLFSSFTVGFYTVKTLAFFFGDLRYIAWSQTTILMLYTVCLLLFTDFCRYLLHRLLHEVPILWKLHKVHHTATVMTPLTLHRVHPLEAFLQQLRDVVSVGMVTGVFFYLFGQSIDVLTVLGVNAGRFVFNLLGANLRHSHIWLSFGPVLEKILISPAQHQIHHSADPNHHNKNYGSQFALWDYFFNTLYLTGKREKISFGQE